MKKTSVFFGFICVLLFSASSQAHHTAGHGGGNYSFNPFSAASRAPHSYLEMTFTVDSLDGNLGEVWTYQVAGEYAFFPRLSLGARVPFLSIRENNLPRDDKIGDVALTARALLLHFDTIDTALFLGNDLILPTGDETNGFGSGEVSFAPYVTLSTKILGVQAFGTLGTALAVDNNPQPALNFATGLSVPVFPAFRMALNFQGSTLIADDTLENGSTKAFLVPGLILSPLEILQLSAGVKIAVIDTLNTKGGVALAPNSTVPLSDSSLGFIFNANIIF